MWAGHPTTTAPSTGDTSTTAVTDSVQFWQAFWFALLLIGGFLLVGALIVYWRTSSAERPGASLVRSWMAIGLVLGLLALSALSFALKDNGLRNTLLGAVTASVGAAIAFYFSAKSGEQARKDLMRSHQATLDVALGTETVPNIEGKDAEQAATALGMTTLSLKPDVANPPQPGDVVLHQKPDKYETVQKGSSVKVIFGPPN